MARSFWSAMRPITAASASRPTKTASLKLPGPFERHRLLALELIPGALDGASGLVRATGRPAQKPQRRGRLSKDRQNIVDAAPESPAPPFRLRAAADITQRLLEAWKNDRLGPFMPASTAPS